MAFCKSNEGGLHANQELDLRMKERLLLRVLLMFKMECVSAAVHALQDGDEILKILLM